MEDRRRLERKEIRLMLFEFDAFDDATPNFEYARLHAVRQTVNGNMIAPCNDVHWRLDQGENYWLFPLLDFLIANAPVCPVCVAALKQEGIIENLLETVETP